MCTFCFGRAKISVCVCVFGMVVLRVVDVIRICVSSMVTRRYV